MNAAFRSTLWSLLALVALAATVPALPARAALPPAEAHTEHAALTLRSERATVAAGDSFLVDLTLTAIPHWHTYWINPGDTGLPTRVRWTLPEGVQAGPIQWPLPQRLPTPPLMSFGYPGAADLLVRLQVPTGLQGSLPLRAEVAWLVCAEQCVRESAVVGLELPLGAASAAPAAGHIADAAARLALPATGWTLQTRSDGRWLRIDGTVPEGQLAPARLWLFPEQRNLIAPAASQPYHHDGRSFALAVPLAPPPVAAGRASTSGAAAPAALPVAADIDALLVSDAAAGPVRGWSFHAAIASAGTLAPPQDNGPPPLAADAQGLDAPAGGGVAALLAALGLAFAGGLLLNLMPCVLPVLSLKVFALLGDAQASRAHLVRQGLLFLSGVLVSFWVLAVLLLSVQAAGAAVGWGFQLQSPAFVVTLACLFTALAMNFAGLFEVGTVLQAHAGELERRASDHLARSLGSFSAGVLTTLVATPCTAPFLGAGIGFTLGRPAFEALLVFTAMGLGVGLPVTLLALFPGWLRHVPRPGPWMATLKHAFAFPMLGTVAWLAWVLGHQRGVDALGLLLVGLVLVALACWLWGRAQQAMLRAPAGMAARVQTGLAVLALGAGVWLAWPGPATAAVLAGAPAAATPALEPGAAADAWQPYSRARLAGLRSQGKPVFVDFTAAWCLSCQVNKRTSLRTAAVSARMQALGVVPLEADWTNNDPDITAALAELRRNAVPVYAVYPRGGGAPRLLPEVLTQALVLQALDQAAHD